MNRGREVEHGSLVFSASGGMGNAARIFYKRFASQKRGAKLARKVQTLHMMDVLLKIDWMMAVAVCTSYHRQFSIGRNWAVRGS